MRLLPLVLLLTASLLAAGCAAPGATTEPAPGTGRDVLVGGTSILGIWDAVGALDEPDVDDDLRSGLLTETLIVNPYGRVTLTGVDEREGSGPVSFSGRIQGSSVEFDGLPGRGQLEVRGDGRLVLTDPRGNRTVYERRNR